MTSESAKAISTSAIWISVAAALAFLFRMNGPQSFFALATFMIMAGAVLATGSIWWFGRDRQKKSAAGFEVVHRVMPAETAMKE